ncbi:hypothetical protein AB1Y20_001164 [Prymnesium parvum]|uniref:Uncharacterized protein n=1 Tax=Prymnesium parvum TaxID=97485 RepID=A0AB34K6W9_PRYPA
MSEAAGDGSAHGPAVTAQSSNLAPEDTDVGLEGPSRLPALVPSVVDELAGMGCQSDLSAGLSCECCGLEALAPGSRSSNDSSGRAEPRARCGCSPSAQIVRQERLSRTEEVSAVVLLVPTSGSVQASIIVESEPLEEDDQCLIHSPRLHNHMHRDPRHPASHGLFGRTAHGAAAGADHMDLKERQDGSLRYSTPPYSIDMEGRPTSALDADEENKNDTPWPAAAGHIAMPCIRAAAHHLDTPPTLQPTQMHARRRHAVREVRKLKLEMKRQELEHTRDESARLIIRAYRAMVRKREARIMRKREHERQAQAASKIQLRARLKRISRFVGYTGEERDGQGHGEGRMVWQNGSSYDGGWVTGEPDGEGEMIWSDGSCYYGQWTAGQRQGYGVYENKAGDVYTGEWSFDAPNGSGSLLLSNGSLKSGMWKSGKPHGHMKEVIRSADGSEWVSEFIGEFLHGERHGPGRELTEAGEYDGMWKDGLRHGVGRFESSMGWVYRGGWVEGMRHGKGTLTSPFGHRFVGTWERDKLPEGEFCGRYFGEYVGTFRALSDDEDWPFVRHGHGVWKGREGETYDGEWVDDYFHGIGKMKTQSIDYEGGFQRSKRHGKGKLFYADGSWYEGEFKDDMFDGIGELHDSNGVYEGWFRKGLRNGHGIYRSIECVTYTGNWKDGVRHGKGH